MNKYWFKAKKTGWGWYPSSWQGWLVLLVFTGLEIANFFRIDSNSHSASDALTKFVIQTIIMVLIVLVICFKTGEKTKLNPFKFYTYIGIILTTFIILSIISVIYLPQTSFKENIIYPPNHINNSDLVKFRIDLVEKKYPDFKNFEQQKSFAGKVIKTQVSDNNYYFAFIELGSGVPIVKATCFKVDSSGRVFLTGLFPSLVDSVAGYTDVNPQFCNGLMSSYDAN